jgi:hypothetical protein
LIFDSNRIFGKGCWHLWTRSVSGGKILKSNCKAVKVAAEDLEVVRSPGLFRMKQMAAVALVT